METDSEVFTLNSNIEKVEEDIECYSWTLGTRIEGVERDVNRRKVSTIGRERGVEK